MRRERKCFTLVELLVVIAIIAILISILLPVMIKIRKRAMVLACPIAYVGEDSMVHICDPSGNRDLEVAKIGFAEGYKPYGGSGAVYSLSAVWSPSGLKIAANSWEPENAPPGKAHVVLIAEPSTGRIWRHREEQWLAFCSWADSNSYVARGLYKPIYIRDAETAATLDTPPFQDSMILNVGNYGFITRASPAADAGPYIAGGPSARGSSDFYVMSLRKNLSPGKMIWQAPSAPIRTWGPPQIDPSGQWVAWTHFHGQYGPLGIALKQLHQPSTVPPEIIPAESEFCAFCDWTEDGNLLVNSSLPPKRGDMNQSHWQFMIITKKGQVVRRLATPVPPVPASTATWRKYGHQ